jgi:hypothetical protein
LRRHNGWLMMVGMASDYRLDLHGLRLAKQALENHESIIRRSARDLGIEITPLFVDACVRAIEHVIDDGYRSDETRGSS